jgi:hypothetical protein
MHYPTSFDGTLPPSAEMPGASIPLVGTGLHFRRNAQCMALPLSGLRMLPLFQLALLSRPGLLSQFLVKWSPDLPLDVGKGHCVDIYRVESYGVNYKLFPFLPQTFHL